MNSYIKTIVYIFSLFSIWSAFAAGPIDHFDVVLWKETAKVWEALDITISAVDKNSETITDYTGDILVFSESDVEAEFPTVLSENSYSFTSADEWSVKFENAVKFNNSWVQDLYVYDLNDENILWIAEITISESSETQNIEIKILSPENGVTLGKNNITISGTTQKNHQVRIIVNNQQDLFTTSNAEGLFEKEVEWLQQWANTLQAHVLNADNEKIGESERIDIKINSSAPEFKTITITPTGDIEAQSEVVIEVVSNIGLSSVNVIIDDVITELIETKDGIYEGKTLAPSEAGEYPVDVVLKDEFAHETTEKAVETLMITAIPDLTAPDPEPVIEIIETTSTWSGEELDLEIKNIEVTELKTKSVLTWDAPTDAESYNVYKKIEENKVQLVESTDEPRFEIEITGDEIKYEEFAIKAVWKTASGETIQWDLSEMTKVKTGPELYILLGLIALLLTTGIFFMRRTA